MLAQQQLEKISNYCKAMGVKFYDVELELVDHFAGSIEHLQYENPDLSFEDALQLANQQFAPGEFYGIIKNKEQKLQARFKRLLWKEFWAYFTFPKVMLTLCLMGLIISIKHFFNVDNLLFISILLPGIISFFVLSLFRKGSIMVPTKKNINRPKLPLLIHQVLVRKKLFMLQTPSMAYLFLPLILDKFKGVLTAKEYTGFEALKIDISLYLFPLFIIFCLAWRKVFVDQTILMRKQYAMAFEN